MWRREGRERVWREGRGGGSEREGRGCGGEGEGRGWGGEGGKGIPCIAVKRKGVSWIVHLSIVGTI